MLSTEATSFILCILLTALLFHTLGIICLVRERKELRKQKVCILLTALLFHMLDIICLVRERKELRKQKVWNVRGGDSLCKVDTDVPRSKF